MLDIEPVLTLEQLVELRTELENVFIDEKVERYILRLVDGTRNPGKYKSELSRYLRFGASPRASIYLNESRFRESCRSLTLRPSSAAGG